MARMKCRQPDPSTGPSSSKLTPDLSLSALLAEGFVTMPKFPTDVQPVINAAPRRRIAQNLDERFIRPPVRINVLDVFIIPLQGGSVSKVDGKPTHDMTDIEGISLILGGTGRACEAEGLGGVRKLILRE